MQVNSKAHSAVSKSLSKKAVLAIYPVYKKSLIGIVVDYAVNEANSQTSFNVIVKASVCSAVTV